MTKWTLRSRIVLGSVIGGVTVALAIPEPSHAQTVGTWRPERPNRALFGGGTGETEQSLSLRASLSNTIERITFPLDPAETTPDLSETSHVAQANLAYSVTRNRVVFNASAGASAFYFGGFDRPPLIGQSVNLAGRWQVAGRTTLSGNADASRQPLSVASYLPGFYGTAAVVPVEYASGTLPGIQKYWRAGLQAAHQVTSRTSVSAGYELRQSDLAEGTSRQQSAEFWQAAITHRVSRGLGLRLGYGEGIGRFSGIASDGTDRPKSRAIDAGIEFERALSLSRRTHLAVRTGSAGVSDDGSTRYWITGSAALTREVGRTWAVNVAYDRKVDLLETFQGATFSDTVSAGLGGLIQRRIQFYSSVSAAVGSVGLTRAGSVDNRYSAYQAQTGITLGLTRLLGLTVSGFMSRHDFGEDLSLPIPNQVQRVGVRAGIDLWVPLFHRMRSTNAAR